MPPLYQRAAHSLATAVLLLALTGCLSEALAEPGPAVAVWSFENTLADRSGHGNDAYAAPASFVPGHSGQGLRCGDGPAVVPDSPQLRLAPGLQLDCWVKLDVLGAPGSGWKSLLFKEHAYHLRVDPPEEGGHFSFFLDLDGWEPRARSRMPATAGAWYHLRAGWDGTRLWLEVNGERTTVPRSGVPVLAAEPLELGGFQGVLDEVRIENPAAPSPGVAQWLFEGDLRDSSGHSYDLKGGEVSFLPSPDGQALQCRARPVSVASNPDLQLAPGFRLDCSVRFEKLPTQSCLVALKEGEYQLRVDPAEEGGYFAFFVNLNGGWEPRVRSAQRVEPGQWYRLVASWNGSVLVLEVNGKRSRVLHSGLAKPTGNPLTLGGPGQLLDHLGIENPRLPVLQVRPTRQEHAILVAGRPEKLTTTIRNNGPAARQVVVHFKLPAGIRCLSQPAQELGDLPTGAEKTLAWAVQADAAVLGKAELRVTAADAPALTTSHPLVFFATEEGLPLCASETVPSALPSAAEATTYYIDSIAGDNANAGTSPEAPWKDFTRINGRVLGPGERLLLRRGSVFNQELSLSAKGTRQRWAEIGAYGAGARPLLRRNRDINERCALIRNPDFLRIRDLTVAYAAKGLVVTYTQAGHQGLVIENCLAHHIEGLYRFNAHGIPEWRDQHGPAGDPLHTSAGIAIAGAPATGLILRDSESFQCSSGFYVSGDDVLVDRVFCHDNFAHNTSPHPFLVGIRRALLRNSIFDASGWHASAGTMGIMLGDPQGLIIRNCFFRNQPDSGSADEGGVDFENSGSGCRIEHCTFENNAGAAVEVLGLQAPQTSNIEIRNSRFLRNNHAKKLGPSELFIWGEVREPSICSSSGRIEDNGYVLLPGICFFTNQAPHLASWTLTNNTAYATVEQLERAMPFNRPPQVDAGPDLRTAQRRVALAGQVRDDGKPAPQRLSTTWEVLEGPGPVSFENAHAPATTATFEQPGDYLLRLAADDGELWRSAMVAVHILPAGTSVLAAWEFNHNLDKEGWTEVNPGTRLQKWTDQSWPTTSHPVKLVGGGYFVLAIDNSPDAHLLSADHLGVALAGRESLTLRFQNHTPATSMRLRFTTEADPVWDDAKSRVFPVVANDNESRSYSVDLSSLPGAKGRLRQLRLDLATGQPLTGTCRFDYIWVVSAPAR